MIAQTLSNKNSEYQSEREKALGLSDVFNEHEGRRPRILVADASTKVSQRFNSMCSALADMGCNVDLAPKILDLQEYAAQCLENDADILLLIVEKVSDKEQLMKIQNLILPFSPDTILAILFNDSNCCSKMDDTSKWLCFDDEINDVFIGKKLLYHLMTGP